MDEQKITFQTAKLAKEKGFDWPIKARYSVATWSDNKWHLFEEPMGTYNNSDKSETGDISAPTQSILQKWLRENFDTHIVVERTFQEGLYELRILMPDKNGKYSNRARRIKSFESYEDALEVGLFKALELIK